MLIALKLKAWRACKEVNKQNKLADRCPLSSEGFEGKGGTREGGSRELAQKGKNT